MQCLLTLKTEEDPITHCRLMNIFRRKGLKIVTLAMGSQPGGFSLLALVEFKESDLEHIFNFLRRTDGVEDIACYRHDPSAGAAFIFVDGGLNASAGAKVFETFPQARLIFASYGKCLFEVPSGSGPPSSFPVSADTTVLPFVRVMSAGGASRRDRAGTLPE